MSAFQQLAWLEAFRNRVNADPEMKLIGRWFSTSISLSFGDTRYVLRVERGRIGDIAANPRIDARACFRVPRSCRGLAQIPERHATAALS